MDIKEIGVKMRNWSYSHETGYRSGNLLYFDKIEELKEIKEEYYQLQKWILGDDQIDLTEMGDNVKNWSYSHETG